MFLDLFYTYTSDFPTLKNMAVATFSDDTTLLAVGQDPHRSVRPQLNGTINGNWT